MAWWRVNWVVFYRLELSLCYQMAQNGGVLVAATRPATIHFTTAILGRTHDIFQLLQSMGYYSSHTKRIISVPGDELKWYFVPHLWPGAWKLCRYPHQ